MVNKQFSIVISFMINRPMQETQMWMIAGLDGKVLRAKLVKYKIK